MSYFFIINPAAGHGAGKIAGIINSLLSNRAIRYEIAFTKRHAHASELSVRAVLAGFRTVVAAGGDGTVRETALPLVGKEQALGIIPCGSGNGLARNLHIPMDASKACEGLLQWGERKIDVALANGTPFFCTAGFGLDAEVARIFNKRKGRRGIFPYVFHSVCRFLGHKPWQARLKIPEREMFFKPLVLTVANGREYGGGAKIAPAALLDDAMLNVVVVEPVSVARGLGMVPSLFNGTLDSNAEVRTFACRDAEVFCGPEIPMHLDGDDAEHGGSVKFSVLPARLKVKAPKPV